MIYKRVWWFLARAVHPNKDKNNATENIYSRREEAFTASSNHLKTSSVEADITSVGSTFKGFTERTYKVNALSGVVVYGLENIQA